MLGKLIVSLSWSLLDIAMWVAVCVAVYRTNWPAAIFCLMMAWYAEGKALSTDLEIRMSERLRERLLEHMKDKDKA